MVGLAVKEIVERVSLSYEYQISQTITYKTIHVYVFNKEKAG
jgi:hypothetical protein